MRKSRQRIHISEVKGTGRYKLEMKGWSEKIMSSKGLNMQQGDWGAWDRLNWNDV